MTSADHLSHLERMAISAALIVYFVIGYFSIQLWPGLDRVSAAVPVLDRLMPFSPSWIWGYVWAIPAAVMPAFIVASGRLFRRTALAYAITITVCLTFFIAMPNTAIALRPSVELLNLARPSEWLVASVYAIDPPGNLFPSLHVSLTALSAYAAWMTNRTLGWVAVFGLTPTIRPIRRSREPAPEWGSQRAAFYVLCVVLFYGAIGGAFMSGLQLRPLR